MLNLSVIVVFVACHSSNWSNNSSEWNSLALNWLWFLITTSITTRANFI